MSHIKVYFTWRPIYVFITSRSVLLRIWNAAEKGCKENQNTQFNFKNLFFLKSPAVYQIMCKNIVKRDRPQMTIWRMRISLCLPKATNTHSQYVILVAFPLQQWLHDFTSILRYTYIVCLVLNMRSQTWLSMFCVLPF